LKEKRAYQTLEDRGNIDEVEREGSFKCRLANAWLGEGYYFWESYIENAHWWGKEGAKYIKNSYIICETKFISNIEKCFDLYDNFHHMEEFNKSINKMSIEGLYNPEITTVGKVLHFMSEKANYLSGFEAIRAYGVNSINMDSHYKNKTKFTKNGGFYSPHLDRSPPIQICFIGKNGLNRNEFKVVFPDEYNEQWGV
jgi:hypothetical protein